MVWSVNYHTMTLLHIDAVLAANVSKRANIRTNNGVDSHNKTNKNTNIKIIFFTQNPSEPRNVSIYLDHLQDLLNINTGCIQTWYPYVKYEEKETMKREEGQRIKERHIAENW